MKQKLLVTSIIMGLAAAMPMASLYAQTANDQSAQSQSGQNAKKEKTQKLETVIVTGSLIPKAEIETATPVITVTGDEMKKQGFRNVYDALKSLPVSTGAVQDAQFSQGFTPGANTIALLGLDPSFTLVLMNGKPLADYPFLYNSNSNFVDLNTIPSFIVDHIDIVPGNQSAIYGSSAIAGVVNIVTKQKLEGTTLDYRVGGYSDGGGAQQRLQLATGHSWGKLDAIFALQLNKQDPVYFRQRDYTNSLADNPTLNGADPIASRDRLELDPFTGYVTPPPGACDPISYLFHGNLAYHYRPGRGYYCGSLTGVADGTMQNGFKAADAYVNLKYQLNDNTQLYSDLLFDETKVRFHTGGNYSEFWATGFGTPNYVWNADLGRFTLLQYVFAPEEVNGLNDGTFLGHSYVVNLGVRGSFGGSNWNYDASFHRSQNKTDSKGRRGLVAAEAAYFLGPQDGYDPYGYGYPAYHVEQQGHIYSAFTPDQYLAMSDVIRSDSKTYTQQANITITNTDLFELPAGSVGFAGLAEVGNQSWDNPVDPRVLAGDFFGIGGTSGGGKRDREAVAAEFNVPIFSMLTADASARWDRYSPNGGGASDSKVTYKLGLEFRPIDTLLLRTNYATAFRAPDMGYVFSTGSKFFNSYTDYYNCRTNQGDDYTNCNPPYDNVQVTGYQNGNKDLKYITAKSFGAGFVWSPTTNFNVKADYYRVKIDNEVNSYSVDTILQKEADCRIGHTRGGTPVDTNSPSCQQFISQVVRNPLDATINPGGLVSVTTYPINISNETVSGIVANAQYRWDAGRYGDFTFAADYNTTLKHVYRQFPDDPETDLLRLASYGNQFKDIGSGSVTWDIGPWSTTVRGIRYGKTFSYDASYTVGPWVTYNASIQYNFSDDAALTLIANNVFNSRPPKDRTFSAFPYYDIFSYNGLGRLVMAEFNMHFGAGSGD